MADETVTSSSGARNRKRGRDEVIDMLEPAEMTLLSPEAVHEIMTQSPGANSDPPAPKKSKAGRKPVPDEPCEHGPSAKSCQKCIYRNRVERVRCWG